MFYDTNFYQMEGIYGEISKFAFLYQATALEFHLSTDCIKGYIIFRVHDVIATENDEVIC